MTKVTYSLMLFVCAAAMTFAQGTKVGVVDADVVVRDSKKGKAFFEEFQAFTTQKRETIEKTVEEFRKKQADYQAKVASMSEEKRKEAGLELQTMQTEIKRMQEDAQRESEQKFQSGEQNFRKEIAPLIRQVALEKGLDLVLNYGPNSSIVYFSDTVNLTQEVIKKYDEMAK